MLEPSRCKSVKRTKINRVFDKLGKRTLFLFDYGDQWHFLVELKGIKFKEEDKDCPLIVESVGKAPPQYGEVDE